MSQADRSTRLKINKENLRQSHQASWLFIDFLMLGLLMVNLTWLILDSIYAIDGVRDLLAQIVPDMTAAYAPIHRNFFFFDLAFVAIFLLEFLVRWLHAIRTKTYARWYFYPFIHWYDIIGCIPAGGYRFLRVLRIFSILHRLHRYQIVDFTNSRVFQFIQFYYQALLEELSDRIVIKVLSGVQEEVREGSPLIHQIQQRILLPRRQLLVDWLSDKVAEATHNAYMPHRELLRAYLATKVDEALRQSRDIRRLQLIPILGSSLTDTLERSIGDIVTNVIDQLLRDLASPENHRFIEDLVEVFLQERPHEPGQLDQEIIEATLELLDLVKKQVEYKRWRSGLDTKLEEAHILPSRDTGPPVPPSS